MIRGCVHNKHGCQHNDVDDDGVNYSEKGEQK